MRRFFQFRLRTLLALMVLCSLAFGWVGASLREWKSEQEALLSLQQVTIEHYDTSQIQIPWAR